VTVKLFVVRRTLLRTVVLRGHSSSGAGTGSRDRKLLHFASMRRIIVTKESRYRYGPQFVLRLLLLLVAVQEPVVGQLITGKIVSCSG
jgi:hypothetical protein